jgi:hypothetical protein
MEFTMVVLWGFLFLWLTQKITKKWDLGLPNWVFPAFLAVKFSLGFILFLLYTYYYKERSEADIFKYFDDATILFNYMRIDPSSVGSIMWHSELPLELAPRMKAWYSGGGFNLFDSSQVMIKLHILIRLVSFGSYHVHSMIFAFASFVGCITLLRVLIKNAKLNPWLVLVCLFMPSFQLWSSGPLKESVSVFLILASISSYYKFIIHQKKGFFIWSILPLVPLYFFKPFYALLLPPAMLLSFIFGRYGMKGVFAFILMGFVFIGIADVFLGSLSPIDIMATKQSNYFDHFDFKSAQSMSGIPPLEPNLHGMVRLLPHVLLNAFLLPLPWESLNPLYLASAVENMIVLGALVTTLIFCFKRGINDQTVFVVFLIGYAIMVYLLLGFTCPVIGSLMRFKSCVEVFVPLAALIASAPSFEKSANKDFA